MFSELGKKHLIEIVRERYAEEGDHYYWYILNAAGVLNLSKGAREIHTTSLT